MVNEKICAVNRLRELDLLVPPSIIVTRQEYPNLRDFIRNHKDVAYWYLRSIRHEESIVPKNVVTTANLTSTLDAIFTSKSDAKIIVQERVDVSYSGVLAKTDSFIFVEYVKGGLKSLLRDGVTPSRVVFNLSGETLAFEMNQQEFWYRWDGDQLVKQSSITSKPLSDIIRKSLLKAANHLKISTACEWVQDDKGKVLFLDMKSIPDSFLMNKDSLLTGFRKNTIVTLDSTLRGPIVKNVQDTRRGVYLVEKPLYLYIEDILERATAVICQTGGALSHLLLYAAKTDITCVISPFYYNKFLAKEEINISSSELLYNDS